MVMVPGTGGRFDALRMDSESSINDIISESLNDVVSGTITQAISERNTSSVNTRESKQNVGGKPAQSKNGSVNGGNNDGSVKQPRTIDSSTVGEITDSSCVSIATHVCVITADITASTKQVMGDLVGVLV